MSSDSPAVILYDSTGTELAVPGGTAIPIGTRGFLATGTDGTNARVILVDGYSRLVISGAGSAGVPVGGILSIQGVVGGIPLPVSGSFSANFDGYATSSTPTYVADTFNPFSLTLAGALRTDGSATTQPVSGTITAQQSTAANLNATVIGTTAAGSGASSGLITVQGNAFGTPIPVSGTFSASTDGYATSSAPVYVNNTSNPLSLTLGGALRIDGSATTQPVSGTITVQQSTAANLNATVIGTVTSNQGTANTLSNAWPVEITDGTNVLGTSSHPVRTDPTGATTQPVSGTLAVTQSTSPWVTNVNQFGGNNVVTGTGTSGVGIPRVTVSNDSSVLATQSGTWTVQQGGPPWSVSQSGTWTVQPGNTQNTTAWLVQDSADGPVVPGSVAAKSMLIGGQYNTALPTLTNTQQASFQLDSSGRLITSPIIDIGPSTQNITAQDISSTTTTVANSQVFVTGTPTAGSTASFNISTKDTIRVQVSGTWTGTLTLEGSLDGGTTWVSINLHQTGTSYNSNNFTSNFIGTANVASLTQYRARATSAWTGTATVLIVESSNINSSYVTNPILIHDSSTQSIVNTVKASNTAAAASDTSIVVALSPNSSLPTGSNVVGSVNQGSSAALANAWSTKITDSTNGPVAVKPTSTTPSTSDPSLVVSLSPNSAPVPLPQDNTVNGNIVALNGIISISTSGCAHVGISITGTWSASLVAEGTIDGTNWFTLPIYILTNSGGTESISSVIGSDSVTYNGLFRASVHGLADFRIRASSFVSGTASVYLRSTVATGPDDVQAVTLADNGSLDAFSRLRVANPETLFSSKQLADNQPLFWDDQAVSGTGTSSAYQTNQAMTNISVTLNAVGVRARQTFRRFNYQPGKGQLITMTGILVTEGGAGNAACNRRIGLFDSNNGLFFQLTGTTLQVAVRTFTSGSAVTTSYSQSGWNMDTLDGSGGQNNPSGLKMDVSKTQIFIIDFQWLGVGRIRFGFNIAGRIVYCHQVFNANSNTLVYISVPNLPLRYEIESLGTGTNTQATLSHICSSVDTEGGFEDIGFQLAADRGTSALTTGNNTNIYSLLAMQLRTGYFSATIKPTYIGLMSPTANVSFRYFIVLNPTIAGAALSYTAVTNSAVQFAVPAATNTLSGGTVLFSDYQINNKTSSSSIPVIGELVLGSSIAGVSDTLVLGVQPVPANGADYYAAINWREIL